MSNKNNWIKNYIGKNKPLKEEEKNVVKEEVANNWQDVINKLIKEAEQKRQVAALNASVSPPSWYISSSKNYNNLVNYNVPPVVDYQYKMDNLVYNVNPSITGTTTNFNMFADSSWLRKFFPSGDGVFFPCE